MSVIIKFEKENKSNRSECSVEYQDVITKFDIEYPPSEKTNLDLRFRALIEGLTLLYSVVNGEDKRKTSEIESKISSIPVIIKFGDLFLSSLADSWIDLWRSENFMIGDIPRPNKAYCESLSKLKDLFLSEKNIKVSVVYDYAIDPTLST
jgi:hypothetical protein